MILRVWLLACMRDERFFDVLMENDLLQAGASWDRALDTAISTRLDAGGYVVCFLSAAALASPFVRREVERALNVFPDRVVFAWLDRPRSLPTEFPVPRTQWLVLHRSDVESRLNWNEIDRLIVMLYWRIYRNTRAKELH